MTATAKKATTRKTAKKVEPTPAPAPAKPATRSALLDRLKELGYTGPTSFTASFLRETLVPWLEAGAPKGDGSIPDGCRFDVYPDLRPAPKAGNVEVRTTLRELRLAVAAVPKADDAAEALNVVDGLSARLRELLVTA
ncbi:hypothetical protein [Nocardioides sp. CFH 31398]|uniref:hypothetical protein n=1 Tax=Nocardioides sp. CFH 31398 TaxID=2919579 RepID=UPI001F057E43|nr:hypothetical protein [Nocardioides sp. CFH 31398]MCH1867058.1 hypothetical protein [Nocardioides sp. CFH 31398]